MSDPTFKRTLTLSDGREISILANGGIVWIEVYVYGFSASVRLAPTEASMLGSNIVEAAGSVPTKEKR